MQPHHRSAAPAVSSDPLGAAVLLLAACGFGAQPTPTPEPITLRYITFPGLAAAEDALIGGYRADHPEISMAVEQYNQTPDAMLAQRPVPDVMLITPRLVPGQGDRLWRTYRPHQSMAGIRGCGTRCSPACAALSEREGKQYYLPVGYNWNGFYYDKAVFEQYGLQPPTTWDEFLQVCETLWMNGVVPLSMSGEDPFMG